MNEQQTTPHTTTGRSRKRFWIAFVILAGLAWMFRFQAAINDRGQALLLDRWTGAVYVGQGPSGFYRVRTPATEWVGIPPGSGVDIIRN